MARWAAVGLLNPDWPAPNAEIGDGYDLGAGIRLEHVPAWIRSDHIRSELGRLERGVVEDASFALVARYERGADDDEEITLTARNRLLATVVSLWLAKPSPAGIRLAFDVIEIDSHTDTWGVRSLATDARLALHPRDLDTRLDAADLNRTREINTALAALPPGGAPYVASRVVFDALHTRSWRNRYLFFWIALEALFAGESGGEAAYRLAYRVSLFLRSASDDRRHLFRRLTKAYGIRSAIAHGHRRRDVPDSDAAMGEVEDWVRDALAKIVLDAKLAETFSSSDRDRFLEEMAFGA